MASVEQHVFSTGALLVGTSGATPLDPAADKVAVIQSADITIEYQTKELRDAAQVSLFPVDVAETQGNVKLKATTGSLDRKMIQAVTGGTYTAGTANAPDTIVIGKTSHPTFNRIEFTGTDTTGRTVKLVMQNARAKGTSIGLKQEDFATPDAEWTGYVDAAGNVATISFSQT